MKNQQNSRLPIKTGFGYDSHRFLTKEEIAGSKSKPVETGTDYIDLNKPLIMGGVKVDGDYPPFKARSDGDVVIHAAVNAILSALALDEARDIGTLFPNTDKSNSNRDSKEFLFAAHDLVKKRGYVINDLKLTVKSKPRVDLGKVRENIAGWLDVPTECVLIQGTSGEDMDAAGKGFGVEVFGICTIIDSEYFKSH